LEKDYSLIGGLFEGYGEKKCLQKTHNPQSLPFVKDVACYDYILSQQSQEKKGDKR